MTAIALKIKNKPVGEITEDADGTLAIVKHVQAKNFLHRFSAWAVADTHIALAETYGALRILLIDEHGREYRAPLGTFKAHSKSVGMNRGYEPQRMLEIGYWQIRKPGEAEQLVLF